TGAGQVGPCSASEPAATSLFPSPILVSRIAPGASADSPTCSTGDAPLYDSRRQVDPGAFSLTGVAGRARMRADRRRLPRSGAVAAPVEIGSGRRDRLQNPPR